MSSEYFDLEKPIIYTRTATKFSISISSIYLNISCSIVVMLYDTSGCPIDSRSYTLEGIEYDNWTTDQYIIDFVQKKLNEE